MKKFYSIALVVCCLLLLGASTCFAFGQIMYPDRPLNLRRTRSPKAEWVGSLYPGQKVRVAFDEDGWVAIFEPNETRHSEKYAVGYSNAKYLKPTPERVEPKPWGEPVVTSQRLNVRTQPSVRGNKVTLLDSGEHFILDFPDGDWTLVFTPDSTIRSKMNAIGYSSARFFEPAPLQAQTMHEVPATETVAPIATDTPNEITIESTPAPVESDVSAPGSWGTVLIMKNKVNLREDRTSTSHYIRTLQPGEKVRVDFLKNGWYAVFNQNEPLRKENRALGYALQSMIEGLAGAQESEPSEVVIAPTPPRSRPRLVDESGHKTMIIDRKNFSGGHRPDPTPDKVAHGYKYRLLEKSETKKYGESWITLKVFLGTKTLPNNDALKDFATTLWKEHKRATRNLVVLVYLPGMDTDDLSYGVVQFSDQRLMELWVRKTTLLGTKFL